MCLWALTTNVLEHMLSMGNCFASWCRVCCQQVSKSTFCTSFTGQYLFLGQSLFTRSLSKPAGSDALSSLSAQGTGLHLGNISKAITPLILPHILRCWWGLLVQKSTVLLSEPPPPNCANSNSGRNYMGCARFHQFKNNDSTPFPSQTTWMSVFLHLNMIMLWAQHFFPSRNCQPWPCYRPLVRLRFSPRTEVCAQTQPPDVHLLHLNVCLCTLLTA